MTTIREWLSHLRNKTKQSVEKTKAETQKTYNKILDTEIDDIKSKSKSTLKNIDEKLVDASETFKSDVSKTSKKIGKFVYKFLKYSLILIVIGGFLFTLPSIISSFKDEIVPYLQNYTKAKYIENSDIMQFEGSTIHPYVFYYIHRNLEPRLIPLPPNIVFTGYWIRIAITQKILRYQGSKTIGINSIFIILVSAAVANNKHQIRIDEENSHSIKNEEELISKINNLISSIDIIILQDYNKGVLTENVIKSVIRIAINNNIPDTQLEDLSRHLGIVLGGTIYLHME